MTPSFSQIKATEKETKIVVIGRHKFTEIQEQLLKKFFKNFKIISQIQQLDINSQEQIRQLNSADAIIIQTLPVNLIAELIKKVNKPVFMFEIKAITVTSPEEAEKVAKEHNADIITVDPRTGNARVSKTTALLRIKSIKIETETVATVNENESKTEEQKDEKEEIIEKIKNGKLIFRKLKVQDSDIDTVGYLITEISKEKIIQLLQKAEKIGNKVFKTTEENEFSTFKENAVLIRIIGNTLIITISLIHKYAELELEIEE